jgi:hypothetical protein
MKNCPELLGGLLKKTGKKAGSFFGIPDKKAHSEHLFFSQKMNPCFFRKIRTNYQQPQSENPGFFTTEKSN